MDEYLSYEASLHDRRRTRYAVVAFLPRTLSEIVAPFREKFDPDYGLVAPHITVVFPFETKQPLEEVADQIKAETQDQQVIPVHLDSIGDFYPKAPVIYWSVRKNSQLTELYFRLYSRLGMAIPYKQFIPHVTVAKEISPHRLIIVKEQIASYLAREKFQAGSVDLLTPLVDGKWVSVRTFPFKGFDDNSLLML